MKTTLFMAISLNGMIARKSGEEDFISDENWQTFVALVKKTGCVIWGRKTLEIVKSWDKIYLDQLDGIKKVIVSKQNLKLSDDYILATSPKEALEILEKNGFREVILCGGSKNNSSFAKEKLINEIILNVEPVLIGEGLPIFSPDKFDLDVKFKRIKKLRKGMVQLNYDVIFV